MEYLESLCVSQFMMGTKDEISAKVKGAAENAEYKLPTCVLPEAPHICSKYCGSNNNCQNRHKIWWQKFKNTVDDLLLRLNVHNTHDGPK